MPPLRKINVMMVHGTWSSGKWTATDSDFCEALDKKLATIGLEPVFMAIPWSGKNRWLQRERVTHRLCDSIARLAQTQGKHVDFLLVAHSHGGNIATDAARSVMRDHPDIPIKGVICMNTPFLTREPRSATVQYWVWSALAFLLALLSAAPLLMAGADPLPPRWVSHTFPWLPELAPDLIVPIAATLAVLGTVLICFSLLAKDTDHLRLNDRWEPAPNTLCLSCPDDEAITGLGLLEGIANLPQLMLHGLALCLPAAVIAWLHWRAGQHDFCALQVACWAQSGLAAGLVVGVWLLTAILMGVVGAFFVANAFGLRKREFLNNLVSRVLVSYTPLRPARSSFRCIRELPGGLTRFFSLSHSRIYEADQTLQEISDWIEHLDRTQRGDLWQPTILEAA